MAHRTEPFISPLPSTITQTPAIQSFTAEGVVLTSGEILKVDSVIFCTGYLYTFPFLSESCQITVKDGYINSLYKHIININHPTMSFIGIPSTVLPFPLFYNQIYYVLASLEKTMVLPSESDMLKEENEDLKLRLNKGWALKYGHKFGDLQWAYHDDLTCSSNNTDLPEKIENIYRQTSKARKVDLPNYKKMEVVEKDGGFHLVL